MKKFPSIELYSTTLSESDTAQARTRYYAEERRWLYILAKHSFGQNGLDRIRGSEG
jgi:hypothetical protein